MTIAADGTNAVLAAGQALELEEPHDFVRYRGGRSPRQQRLDKLMSFYDCEQYAARKVAWDGSQHVGQFERDTIALAGYVPPGFYVANGQTIPIQFRRPTTPYHLARVIIDRFTSLVFSEDRHPRVMLQSDAQSDALVQAVVKEGKLWPTMTQVRMFGGATGTSVFGFKLLSGRPVYEVLDPRWCTPTWLDRPNLVLKSLEYCYPFVEEVKVGRNVEQVEMWHRRVIDMNSDIVFEPMIIDDEDDVPIIWRKANVVAHGLGFCPIVWIQNTPKPTDIDGDPDCVGAFDLFESIDRLSSQSDRALIANLDPTMVIASDGKMGEIRKGSDNAVKVMKGDTVTYLEITAAGISAAEKKIENYRGQALEVTQCVLENPGASGGTPRTATEVNRVYSTMLAKAGILRTQYGAAITRAVNMTIVGIKRVTGQRVTSAGLTRGVLVLPTGDDGKPLELGPGPYRSTMKWPPYFDKSPDDTQKATNTAVIAKAGGLIDQETAVRYVADDFGVEDVKAMVAKVKGEQTADQAALEAAAISGPRQVAKVVTGHDDGGPSDEEPGS